MFLLGPKGKILDFNQRLEISIDVAHGLTYLHLYAGTTQILQTCSLSLRGCLFMDFIGFVYLNFMYVWE